MNYLTHLYSIMICMSFNCTMLRALVSVSSDFKSVVVSMNAQTFNALGSYASELKSKIAKKLAVNLKNVHINTNVDIDAQAVVLGVVHTNINVDVNGEINCEVVECSSNLIEKVELLGELSMIAEALVKTALSTKAQVEENTNVYGSLNTPTSADTKAIVTCIFSGNMRLKLFTEFTEMRALIESSSVILPVVSVATITDLGNGSVSEVIDLDINAILTSLNALQSNARVASITTLTSELKLLIIAYVSDYYDKTISGAFYGGTLEDAWVKIV